MVMREKLEKRLVELKKEYESGQQMMVELETKQNNLRDTLLRISGAIQILEEELSGAGEEDAAVPMESGAGEV
jgi:hypothetical protein